MEKSRSFKLGNTSIKIIFPEITKEENEKRKGKIKQLATRIAEEMILTNE